MPDQDGSVILIAPDGAALDTLGYYLTSAGISRSPEGLDSDNNRMDFRQGTPTAGAGNQAF